MDVVPAIAVALLVPLLWLNGRTLQGRGGSVGSRESAVRRGSPFAARMTHPDGE